MTNKRYIAIEHNSGFIWGEVTTSTPEIACGIIDHEADSSRPARAWRRVPPIRDTDGGYHLYIAPAGFRTVDEDQVRAECLHVGDYKPVADIEEAA
jgi:hypothetical protein